MFIDVHLYKLTILYCDFPQNIKQNFLTTAVQGPLINRLSQFSFVTILRFAILIFM